ncbi:MAG: MBL fold metallo-hydrolase [Pseudomonadota bacterium]
MNKFIVSGCCALVSLAWCLTAPVSAADAQTETTGGDDNGKAVVPPRVVETKTHRLQEIVAGVYLAQSTARLFNSNALVVVNDDDVLVVDSHITPTKARELIRSIRKITRKPITTLINSHFHYDHAHGNQAFGEDVVIIGHEFTRMKMAGTPLQEHTFTGGRDRNIERLAQLQQRYENESDKDKKAQLRAQADLLRAHVEAWEEIEPVAPNLTLKDRMTLYRGSREIQLHFFGRAHTGGDIVLYLPADKLAFTGDMALYGPSWLGDGYVDEWVETLENFKRLDFNIIVPGHGPAFAERRRIDLVQAFYTDLWQKVAAARSQGLSVAEAAQQIDMTNHLELGIVRVGFDQTGVARMYARMAAK